MSTPSHKGFFATDEDLCSHAIATSLSLSHQVWFKLANGCTLARLDYFTHALSMISGAIPLIEEFHDVC